MYFYKLTISVKDNLCEIVTNILGIESTFEKGCGYGWGYEVEEGKEDEYYDFINEFLNILEGREKELEAIGIKSKDIIFWMVYEYEGQCNMEFRPDQMRRIGEKGYHLCISCYEAEPEYQEA